MRWLGASLTVLISLSPTACILVLDEDDTESESPESETSNEADSGTGNGDSGDGDGDSGDGDSGDGDSGDGDSGDGDGDGDTPFACGENTCYVADAYCSVGYAGPMGIPPSYECAAYPPACEAAPSCECLEAELPELIAGDCTGDATIGITVSIYYP